MHFYQVGGAVRDMLLHKSCQDRDFVVTGGTEKEMLALGFKKVGKSFPVFLHPETGEEYALARREVKTGLGHSAAKCHRFRRNGKLQLRCKPAHPQHPQGIFGKMFRDMAQNTLFNIIPPLMKIQNFPGIGISV